MQDAGREKQNPTLLTNLLCSFSRAYRYSLSESVMPAFGVFDACVGVARRVLNGMGGAGSDGHDPCAMVWELCLWTYINKCPARLATGI